MGVQQKKIAVHDLQIGMFVSDLDRPWHETPFPIQGFLIRSEEEIRALVSYCRAVFVDVAEVRGKAESESATPSVFGRRSKRSDKHLLKLPPITIKGPRLYPVSQPLKKEVKEGERILREARSALNAVMALLHRGEVPDLKSVDKAVRAMADSVIRNPDALLWLTRIQQHDEYTYRHSLNVAVWALVFGRHLGLQPNVLHHLGLGALLCHVGKLQLPEALLQNEMLLGAEDFALFKTYVDKGVSVLASEQLPEGVLNVVRYHRERHNGSGFPQGVTGDRIPLLGKVVGIVDFYESLIEPREGSTPMTPAQAVAQLYDSRNIEFQEDLVERFIQAVGVYPTGTLVELSNAQLGVVVCHQPNRRLWPKVLVMTDSAQQPLKTGKVVDLAEYNEGRSMQDALQIAGCIPFGECQLDPSQFEVTGATSRWSWKHLTGS
ncbi:HD-GYP domain-containing protein [Mangrovitalea sediminis]|uniref:HD-GYP domain-containing protein n=1 Tax=Mangrovitalea sediminis TaxID=1982043 RepID=UPI000BE4B8CF|nr:HD-GYP domain-containing protein [Mangrovitalea sediminis]